MIDCFLFKGEIYFIGKLIILRRNLDGCKETTHKIREDVQRTMNVFL